LIVDCHSLPSKPFMRDLNQEKDRPGKLGKAKQLFPKILILDYSMYSLQNC